MRKVPRGFPGHRICRSASFRPIFPKYHLCGGTRGQLSSTRWAHHPLAQRAEKDWGTVPLAGSELGFGTTGALLLASHATQRCATASHCTCPCSAWRHVAQTPVGVGIDRPWGCDLGQGSSRLTQPLGIRTPGSYCLDWQLTERTELTQAAPRRSGPAAPWALVLTLLPGWSPPAPRSCWGRSPWPPCSGTSLPTSRPRWGTRERQGVGDGGETEAEGPSARLDAPPRPVPAGLPAGSGAHGLCSPLATAVLPAPRSASSASARPRWLGICMLRPASSWHK